jgi:hypothetical protein
MRQNEYKVFRVLRNFCYDLVMHSPTLHPKADHILSEAERELSKYRPNTDVEIGRAAQLIVDYNLDLETALDIMEAQHDVGEYKTTWKVI